METKKVMVTPEMAYELLKTNNLNRPLRRAQVEFYTDQMLSKKWILTGQGISIDEDGKLIDGQHRLAAIVKSKQEIEIMVTKGMKYDDVFHVYDTGIARTGSDVLRMSDVKNNGSIAAGIRLYLTKKNTKSNIFESNGKKISNTDIINEYKSDSDYYQLLNAECRAMVKKINILPKSFIFGLIAYLNKHKGIEYSPLIDFFGQLFSGVNVTNTSIIILRDKLINEQIRHQKTSKLYKGLLVMKTWNAFRLGKEYKLLSVNLTTDRLIEWQK